MYVTREGIERIISSTAMTSSNSYNKIRVPSWAIKSKICGPNKHYSGLTCCAAQNFVHYIMRKKPYFAQIVLHPLCVERKKGPKMQLCALLTTYFVFFVGIHTYIQSNLV